MATEIDPKNTLPTVSDDGDESEGDEDEEDIAEITITPHVPIPSRVTSAHLKYKSTRRATFQCWKGSAAIILTQFSNRQVHRVSHPGGYRRQLTFLQDPILACTRAKGAESPMLYLQVDTEGNERYQVVRVNLEQFCDDEFELLSDGESRNGLPIFTANGTHFAYSTTRRCETEYDIVMSSVKEPTKYKTILQAPSSPEFKPGLWNPLEFSQDGVYLLVQFYRLVIDSRIYLLKLDADKQTLLPVGKPGTPGKYSVGTACFSKCNQGVFYTSDVEGDFQSLRYFDLTSGADYPLTTPGVDRSSVSSGDEISGDITYVVPSPNGSTVAFVANIQGYSYLYIGKIENARFNEEGKPTTFSFSYYREELIKPGLISDLHYDDTGHLLGFTYETPTSPADVYTYNEVTRIFQQWTFSEIGGMKKARIVTPTLHQCDSHDEKFKIPIFYYKPPLPPIKRRSKPITKKEIDAKKFPVVIYLHGGPAKQFTPGFVPRNHALSFQLICEMGIAVLAPNVRGSTGYGRTYVTSDDGLLREDSIEDVGSVIKWAEAQEELDGKKIAVMGRSYGGFLTLASLIHFSDKLVCGMETCGITNFYNFLTNTAPYRAELRRREYGDERNPEVKEFIDQISPLNSADKLIQPVLLAHGRNDSRVPFSEFELMVNALRNERDRKSDIDHSDSSDIWTFVAGAEGHVFESPDVISAHAQLMVLFLERYLIGYRSNIGRDELRKQIAQGKLIASRRNSVNRIAPTNVKPKDLFSYQKPPTYFHALRPYSLGKTKDYTITSVMLAEEAQKVGITVENVSAHFGITKLSYKNTFHLIKQSMIPLTSGVAIWISDQKSVSYDILAYCGFPVPKSVMIPIERSGNPDEIDTTKLQEKYAEFQDKSPEELKEIGKTMKISENTKKVEHDSEYEDKLVGLAKKAADIVGFPCVVKPEAESSGRGVSCNITSQIELEEATKLAYFHAVKSPGLIVQEHIDGDDFRILVVDFKVVAVSKRVPAHVYGDGAHTILELIELENANPLRKEGHTSPLTRITVDTEVIRVLLSFGLTLNSIPRPGVMVMLRDKANLSTGGISVDLTDSTPEENKALVEKLCKSVQMNVCGVDVRCHSVTKVWSEEQNPFKVIELNSRPGCRMHQFPSVGNSRNVVAKILKALFPEVYEKKKLKMNAQKLNEHIEET
eukprot:CAMPEP_0206204266 /NCGR_PEP_ID=MMETSP0166-20121206/13394_1 /ASSEMBLY_ACC=CAM_ASM_000260 /TAXON_ID=95228 /ORGANISM="Vannella robusta, Strain DIVA3 518/3/11/1/6" /LENGTH=1174 /DNA_ID=CAMNT_0053623805 /DNA_START=134 /DNA_END=3654 /DNA_ORIENTATION=-